MLKLKVCFNRQSASNSIRITRQPMRMTTKVAPRTVSYVLKSLGVMWGGYIVEQQRLINTATK
jgi:transcriptional regulator CtsR